MKKNILSSVILLFLFYKVCFAFDLNFEHITTNEGLSQSTVNCIFQDSKGFIWLGTNDGLNKYDGYSITVYKHDPKDSLSLGGNTIMAICEDTDGNLWLGTRWNGLNKFDPKTETFVRYITSPDNDNGISNNTIRNLLFSNNSLWIATSFGLNRYLKETDTFKRYLHVEGKETSIHDNLVYSLLEDEQGFLWVNTNGSGISRFDISNESFEYIPNPLENINVSNGHFGKKLYRDSKGNIWMGCEGDGFFRFNIKTRNFYQFSYYSDTEGLNNNTITSFLEDESGKIWVGTDGGGINVFDPSAETFEYIKYDPKNSMGISTNAIYSLYKDRSEIVWVGTYSGGVDFYKKYKYKFEHYTNDPNNPNSLSYKIVMSICEDSNNRIWLGIDGGGADIFDPFSKSFTHFRHDPENPSSISSDAVICVYEDSDGDIWLGTYKEGVNLYIKETNSFRHFKNNPDDPLSLGFNNVWAVYEDSQENLWFGLMGRGLDLYDKESGTFKHFRSNQADSSTLSSNNLKVIFEDSKDNLWIGTDGGGLNLMDRDQGTFRRFQNNPDDNTTISHFDIKAIYEDHNGNLWIGTGDGLNLLDYNSFTFTVFRKEDGLPDNSINGILEDNSGNLWITTNKGLSRFNPTTLKFRNYDISDGLQGNEFNYTSQCKTSTGELYFGGNNGFNIINPDKIEDNPYIPPVVITAFQIYNKPIKFIPTKEGRKTVYRTIGETKKLKLTHKQNVIGFEFAALDFTNPQKNQYAYKLEGFDKDWNYTSAGKRYASYTNLKGGDYIFRVIGSNSDNIWNNEGVSLIISVKPPFWKTVWFVAFVILAISFSIYYFIKIRVKNIRHDKEILEHKMQEGLKLVEQQKLEVANIEKELKEREIAEKDQKWFNNGMVKFSDILSKNKENTEKLCNAIITNLVNYTDAIQGALYLFQDDDPQDLHLKLVAGYALDEQRLNNQHILIGEGEVGTCFKECRIIQLENLPSTYARLTSGLGEASPTNSLLIPLKLDETIIGVIELSSFKKLEAFKVHFIEKLSESITSHLVTLQASVKTNRLLEQTNMHAEEMAAQEEELRQNMEEMQATQEEAARREEELNRKSEEFQKKEHDYKKEIERLKKMIKK
ncbi:MAG: GAF domain-containing protein [Bacteroidales bacterium]|nr:GAF domain-containing protein [Bacteroidales bacterium]